MAKFKINPQQIPADKDLRLSNPPKNGINWSWEKRIAVVTKYMALGNLRLVSELEEIPYYTLVYWKNSEPWWPELVEEIKKAKTAQTTTKLSKLIDKSLDLVQDRLENGDIRMVKNKETQEVEISRTPVNMRDAAKVATDLMDKQIRLEELDNKYEINKNTVQDTLAMLATEFAKWARNENNKKAIDVDFKELSNAVHEEREEGLQEGSEGVHKPT